MIFLMLLVLIFTATASVSGASCDIYGILIYDDLGCTPEYDHGAKCPTKYSCKGLVLSNKHCYFRGKVYTLGEYVNDNLTDPSCSVGCFCTVNEVNEDKAGFTCAVLDCPESFGVSVKRGCYRKFDLDHCCATEEICPDSNSKKCVVDGKEYKEGYLFYPENTCFSCVCQKGFKGKFEEPFCRRTSCGQQVQGFGPKIQRSCAPFYAVNSKKESVLCCPDDWICSDGSEVIRGEAKSENACKFGDKTVKVGQTFKKLNVTDIYGRTFKNVKCECVIPPLVKCVNVDF